MYDSHCHLADDVFEADLPATVARAREAGLDGALCIIDAGSDVEIARTARLAALWPGVRFAVGVHPHHAATYAGDPSAAAAAVVKALAQVPLARAIGEVGLDFFYDFAPKDVQDAVFRAQIRLAVARDLPLVVHARDADAEVVRVLDEEGQGRARAVLHCYTGDVETAQRAVAAGFFIGIGGIVTFPKGENVREVVRAIPLTHVLVETDSPFLAPVPFRGRRNEPAWVTRVAETVATLRGVTVEHVRETSSTAYARLFRP